MAADSILADEVHSFAGWEIRPRERLLLVAGERAKVGGRAFDVLLALVLRPGRVVSKSELLDAAWPGLVVEENNLSVQITALRKLLGGAAIVNVSGLGYRLAAVPDRPAAGSPATPPTTREQTLIGRGADLAALQPLLGEVPLLTLVGTGGVGKTAVARALVDGSARTWPDGVHWIDLASIRPQTPLLPRVARALGVLVDDSVAASADAVRALSKLHALVVLDNCEHLLDEVGGCVAPLLRAAPGLFWLTTSQHPLALAGEKVYRLGPLAVPPRAASLDQALACGALALFVNRALAADRSFVLDDTNLGFALNLCNALDGLPLGLELAAARVASLGLRTLHEQLEHLSLSTGARDVPARHLSLKHTYEWSYGLLSPREQRLFRWLQPFESGFTAAMASAVAAGGPDGGPGGNSPPAAQAPQALATLAALVEKSLVQRMPTDEPGSPPRYRLLQSAREFAALRLESEHEGDAAQRRHAEVVASSFADADADLQQWRDRTWSERYLPESGNVGAALAWACSADAPALLARLTAACAQLDNFADAPSRVVQAQVPIERLRDAPPTLRARACSELGWAHFLDGDRELGSALLEQALHDHEALGDIAGCHLALTRLVRVVRGRPGQQANAAALWARLSALDATQVPLRLRLYCESTVGRHFAAERKTERLWQLCRIAQHAGLDAQAAICRLNISDELLVQRRFEEAAEVAGALIDDGPRWLRVFAIACHNRAHALVCLNRAEEARIPAAQMLRVLPGEAHMVMDLFALAAVRRSAWDDAALLAGRSARIRRERDWSADPAEAFLIDETMQALDAALAQPDLARLLELGAAMSTGDVLSIEGLA